MNYTQLIKIKTLASLEVQEADAFTRAIHLDEIPPEYKGLRVIGRGNTSIILEKDPNTAIMLTRDSMKKDWLHFGLEISKNFKVHDLRAKKQIFKDMNIYAIEMPKLYQLSSDNKEIVRRELKFFKKALRTLNLGNFRAKENLHLILNYYEKQNMTRSRLYKLMTFLMDYHSEQWNWDLALRQFAQDKKGNIVLVDPIASSELTKKMHFDKPSDDWRNIVRQYG